MIKRGGMSANFIVRSRTKNILATSLKQGIQEKKKVAAEVAGNAVLRTGFNFLRENIA